MSTIPRFAAAGTAGVLVGSLVGLASVSVSTGGSLDVGDVWSSWFLEALVGVAIVTPTCWAWWKGVLKGEPPRRPREFWVLTAALFAALAYVTAELPAGEHWLGFRFVALAFAAGVVALASVRLDDRGFGTIFVAMVLVLHWDVVHEQTLLLLTAVGSIHMLYVAFLAVTALLYPAYVFALSLRRMAAELETARLARERFFAAVSHELRTPLNSIIGFSGILLTDMAGPLNDEQRRQVEMVNRSGHRLLEFVEDLLDISRLEAGGRSFEHDSFTLGEFIDGVCEMFAPLAEERGLAFTCSVTEPGAVLYTDRRALEQVLTNLVSNAVKYTGSGSVELRVSAPRSGTVEFHVADTGPGIEPEYVDRIFDEFEQVAHARVRTDASGSGLGLAIARKLARALGGDVTVHTRPGEGSTFTVTIPVRLSRR